MLAARTRRYGQVFSVALFDVDHFKAYNDTFGHLAGDEVLRTVAQTFVAQARELDTVHRYGGEELLLVLPEQKLELVRELQRDGHRVAMVLPFGLFRGRTPGERRSYERDNKRSNHNRA